MSTARQYELVYIALPDTTEEGLAEVLLPPGFTLRLGENSSIRMITNRLIDTRVELSTGSAIVDALEARDPEAAVRALEHHLRSSQEWYRKHASAVGAAQ